ncbi:MAG: hypothetical protein IAF02_03745 [Anaerolineae bacterium]|nr:hypothetical protein [Anaerolineae bacterium]
MNREKQVRFGFGVIATLSLLAVVLGLFVLSPARLVAEETVHPELAEVAVSQPAALPNSANLPENVDFMLRMAYQAQVQEPTGHPQTGDMACKMCHSDTDAEVEFESGETMPVQVDLAALAMSVHGESAENPLACYDCHITINDYQYPHEEVTAVNLQDYQVQTAATCERCHNRPHITNHPGQDAAIPVTCTSCHGSHEVQSKETWDSDEAVKACTDCHQQAGVELTDTEQMRTLIRNGLFADETDSDYCLACHSQPGLTMTFPNGDVKSVTVDPEAFHASAHGANNSWDELQCTDCHTDYQYPHEEITIESAREFTIVMNQACEECHVQYFEKSLDSVHGAALLDGNLDAAVCTDCHGAHDTPVLGDEPRAAISHTCEQCHSTIYNEYAESVHGEALIGDDNQDVPNCIDCHGVHDIHDPTTAAARARSPELCAECHANEELMTEYDISTDVFDTYVADFHGTTVALFDYEHEGVPPNTAVCYDCHGVHSIKAPDDPHANLQENLVENCQQCHPDASANFADSWLGHYRPSLENFPIIYLVNLFYLIVIPFTLVFFIFMIATDIYRRIRERGHKKEAANE